jgi:23S rRNA (adenine2503-C2)-methyltransferase
MNEHPSPAPALVQVLPSQIDASVNWIETVPGRPGSIEARYVRRRADDFICYLSSATGCDKACRMCHLTQTGQTATEYASLESYLVQARRVLVHHRSQDPARVVHYNFMARGDALANPVVREQGAKLLTALADLAHAEGLLPRFKISTIMPAEARGLDLAAAFSPVRADLYYSLYSVDPAFRRRWLPKALPAAESLGMIADYQRATRSIPVLHWAFIDGENSSDYDLEQIADAVAAAELRCDFNIVAYNPFSAKQGAEPTPQRMREIACLMQRLFPFSRIKVVDRVGFDVKASCGMFVGGRQRLARGDMRSAGPREPASE